MGAPSANSLRWPLAAIALALVLQFHLALTRAINWDEFWHYSQIHTHLSGGFLKPLLSLHVQLFGWVTQLAGTGVDHIVIIRMFMFACLCVIAWCIYLVAAAFATRKVALLAVLLYLTSGFVLQHGSSFRFDPMAAACLMGCLAVLTRARLSWWALLLAALLGALAMMVTIKSAIYAPAFAGIAWWRWSLEGYGWNVPLRLSAMLLAAVALFGAMYWLHASSLATMAEGNAASVRALESASGKMFSLGDLPYTIHIARAALVSMVLAICIVLTPVLLWKGNRPQSERIALAALWSQILLLGVYHNTAPYFYVFLLPPVAVACTVVVPQIIARYGTGLLCAVLALNVLGIWAVEDRGVQASQARLQTAADTIFTQPVAYFDDAAMLGHFPQANGFMTPWGTENYLRGQRPSFVQLLQDRPVPLLINDADKFAALFDGAEANPAFLPRDAEALRDTYIGFWGPFMLAGEVVAAERTAEIRVPGPYTVRDAAILVDGTEHAAGSVVQLTRGEYRLAPASNAPATLLWGDHLTAPDQAPPPEPYWTDF